MASSAVRHTTTPGKSSRPDFYDTADCDSWDMAKFEVCCHKFADLSEADYGVSILNDSKYGFATCGNLMRLSLLRAPKAPDAHADMGRHHISWAIMPHQGSLSSSTVRAAYDFNHPLSLVSLVDDKPPKELLNAVSVNGSQSLVLDCVKRGEDDEDVSTGALTPRKGQSVILRIYESLGGKGRGVIETTLPIKAAYETNALEDDGDELEISGKNKISIPIELRAFEVKTIRLQL